MNHWQILLNAYLSDLTLRGRKDVTIAAYKNHLKRLTRELCIVSPVYCTGIDVRRACRKTLANHRQSYHGHGSRRLLSAASLSFLRWCMQNGYIPQASLSLNLANGRENGRKTAAINGFEINNLLHTIRRSATTNRLRDEALLAIYAYTGIRRSEPLGIRLSDFDNCHRKIRILNKGGKYKQKPVIPELNTILTSYRDYIQDRSARTGTRNNNTFLFPGRHDNQHLSARQANNIFNKWKKLANIREDLTVHSFRAGFATTLYEECKDFLLVSHALDHHDLQTTATYIDLTPRLTEVMERAFVGSCLLKSRPTSNLGFGRGHRQQNV